MAQTRAPRGRHSPNKGPAIADLLPSRVRVQFMAYDSAHCVYRSLSPYNGKVIVRNQRELDRLFGLIDAVLRNVAAWQE